MTKTSPHPLPRAQSGITLIELMISITIGLVILIGIGTAYLNSTNTTRQRENQSELNEPARVVMQQLRHDVSTAGYVDILDFDAASRPQAYSIFLDDNDNTLANMFKRVPEAAALRAPLTVLAPGLMPIFGCDGAMISTPNAIANLATAVLACGALNPVQQSLQIAYQAAPSALPNPKGTGSVLAPNAATGEGSDCNQQALDPAGAKFAINRYFVRPSATDGINELYCSGSGSPTPQPLARGVEEFVLRYQIAQPGPVLPPGMAAVAAGGAQAQYASAAEVKASALGWANVTAVEICLVSATAVTSGAAATGTTTLQTTRPTCERDVAGANIGNFSANVNRVAGDLRLWKRFTSVVSVRNAIYSSPN